MRSPFCLPSSTFLLRLRLDLSFEGEERLGPEALEVRSQRRERLRIDCIDAARPLSVVCDQIGTLEHPQMLRNGRAAHRELSSEFTYRQWSGFHQPLHDRAPGRIAECIELDRVVSLHLQ